MALGYDPSIVSSTFFLFFFSFFLQRINETVLKEIVGLLVFPAGLSDVHVQLKELGQQRPDRSTASNPSRTTTHINYRLGLLLELGSNPDRLTFRPTY